MLTMDIIKILGKKSAKDWFISIKNNYLFLTMNIIDTYNQ